MEAAYVGLVTWMVQRPDLMLLVFIVIIGHQRLGGLSIIPPAFCPLKIRATP